MHKNEIKSDVWYKFANNGQIWYVKFLTDTWVSDYRRIAKTLYYSRMLAPPACWQQWFTWTGHDTVTMLTIEQAEQVETIWERGIQSS